MECNQTNLFIDCTWNITPPHNFFRGLTHFVTVNRLEHAHEYFGNIEGKPVTGKQYDWTNAY